MQTDTDTTLRLLLALLFDIRITEKGATVAPVGLPTHLMNELQEAGYGHINSDANLFEFSEKGIHEAQRMREVFGMIEYNHALSILDYERSRNGISDFQNRWTDHDPVHTDRIFTLKISLKGEKPPVWRRIKIPGMMSLDDLKEIIYVLFEWSGMQLFAFNIKGAEFPLQDDIFTGFSEPFESSDKLAPYQLCSTLDNVETFSFTYNFKKRHVHHIVIEKAEDDPTLKIPVCLDVSGGSPTEEIDGEMIRDTPSEPDVMEINEVLIKHYGGKG